MYKIFLILLFSAILNAELINGVAIVVKGEAVTLHDIREEMRISKLNISDATDVLIRKKLEEVETKEREISVNSSEIYDHIKQTAAKNNMSISEFYEAVRNSNGLSSEEFKEKTKEKLLSQKLYSAISYSSVSMPTKEEAEEYFELHKNEFTHPGSFDVIIYNTKDEAALQQKINNPMFYSANIKEDQQKLEYERISPELAGFLEKQKVKSFSPIVPDGKGGFMSFYIKEIDNIKEATYESVEQQIINLIMGNKREQVLSDYFARLRDSADIKVIREAK
ncbi:peptidyl-prolyl cis-trans isomerase [Candidatus Sulfurimonas marisnigri]|uniref:Peptidyl-prolyl cis-trans isomerase n=1 Tax=Candidatus Sulfurimonas marisnigri TaxID=2740405 RepID=A0A7S7RPW2_9BACT|nr:peptidylprolyl isomerase [Candidatus Sulfurimonas marisnigri]QOY54807.1 peptidyl-prolyl cis-trans isomerase [Candidatus Sulfurimonas marisnigri]